jgi:ankyrin repeat protein
MAMTAGGPPDGPPEGEPPAGRRRAKEVAGDEATTDESGRTALQTACATGHDRVVAELLLLTDADLGCKTATGQNLLHLVACGSGSVEVARFLLSADPSMRSAKDNQGWTPLVHAGAADNWALCDLLSE